MKKLLSLFLFLFSFLSVQATHMMGADVSYQCLGNGKYKIIAKVYRDCRGVSMGTVAFGAYAGTNGGNGCGSYTLSGLSRTSIKDVSTKCSTASNPCGSANSAFSGLGVEEHTFEATIDFNTSPLNNFVNKSTCCEVTFYVTECCRNGSITTGQSNQNFYATAMVNICNLQKMKNKCNSSPQLSNPPIAFLCCNQPWYYNNGAIDTIDFDSISYKLVNGLQGIPNNSVSYSSPFTARVPMTPYCVPPTTINCTPNPKTNPPRGFYFDTANGDIITTPTKCDESAVICVEQTEWRKDTAGVYRVIGRTRRDMQVWVRDDCGYNKNPIINGPYSYKVCEGEKICFKVKVTDETFTPNQTVPDTVIAKWNAGIPGASFKVVDPKLREKEYEFCWTPPIGSASDVSYSFTVTANDQHCSPPAFATRSFKVKVNPKPTSKRRYTQLKCGRFAMESYNIYVANSYSWSVRDTLAKELFYSTKKTDTMNYYYGGKYIIVHKLISSSSCVTIYSDTVILTQPPKVILAKADSFACYGTTFTLKAKVIAGKPTLKYKWNNGDTLDYTTVKNFKKDSTLMLEVTDGDGCKFRDTTYTFVKPLPVINLGSDKVICTYETNTFDGQNNDTVKYLWNTGDTTRYLTTNLKGLYWVKITDTSYSCVKYDTVILVVNDTVVSNAGPNQAICDKDTFTLKASHNPFILSPTYTWGELGGLSTYKLKSDITKSTYTFTLKTILTQNGRACEDMDTMFVRVKPLPKISWSPKPLKPQCYSYGSIWTETFLVKPHNLGTYDIWNGDKFKKSGNITYGYTPYNGRFLFNITLLDNSKLQSGNNYTTKMYVKFNDTNGCSNIDSTTQTIYGTPIIQLRKATVCQDIGFLMMDNLRVRPSTKNGVNLLWEVVRAPNGVDTSKLLYNISTNSIPNIRFNFGAPSQDFYKGLYTFKLTVRDWVTGCQSFDTVDVNVITEPRVELTTIPLYCENSGVSINLFDYILVDGVKPTKGTIFIQDRNGDRNDPKVSTDISTGIFKTSIGVGTYNIKFVSNLTSPDQSITCSKVDSFDVIISYKPDLKVMDMGFCSTHPWPYELKNVITAGSWGVTKITYPDGALFTPIPKAKGYIGGFNNPYKLMMVGESQYGCKDTETLKLTVINQPEIKFVPPFVSCGKDTWTLKLDTANIDPAVKFRWVVNTGLYDTLTPPGGQVIGGTKGFGKKQYIPSDKDTTNGYFTVKFKTWDAPLCARVIDSIKVLITPYPEPDFTTTNGCQPHSSTFTPIEKRGITSIDYSWGINDTFLLRDNLSWSKTFNNFGYYRTSLTAVNNTFFPDKICATSITKTFEVYPKPSVVFTTDPLYKTTVALPKFKTINTSSVSQNPFVTNMKHNWTWGKSYKIGSDTLKNSNIVFGKDTGTYWIKLIVTTDKGCKDSSMKRVVIGPDIIIFVPDAFTPDNAGPNENNTFKPYVINNKTYEMLIFNRWGEKMYETTDLTKGWDGNYKGQPAQDGVYVYKMMVTSLEDKVFHYNGTFTLIR
jgi:gliding motility-associated-like protein